jgi:hypothetical protein
MEVHKRKKGISKRKHEIFNNLSTIYYFTFIKRKFYHELIFSSWWNRIEKRVSSAIRSALVTNTLLRCCTVLSMYQFVSWRHHQIFDILCDQDLFSTESCFDMYFSTFSTPTFCASTFMLRHLFCDIFNVNIFCADIYSAFLHKIIISRFCFYRYFRR